MQVSPVASGLQTRNLDGANVHGPERRVLCATIRSTERLRDAPNGGSRAQPPIQALTFRDEFACDSWTRRSSWRSSAGQAPDMDQAHSVPVGSWPFEERVTGINRAVSPGSSMPGWSAPACPRRTGPERARRGAGARGCPDSEFRRPGCRARAARSRGRQFPSGQRRRGDEDRAPSEERAQDVPAATCQPLSGTLENSALTAREYLSYADGSAPRMARSASSRAAATGSPAGAS